MYRITLKPGESVFGRCTHCRKLNLMFGNPKQEDVSVQFQTPDDHLDSYCHECREFYSWTPSTAIIENTHPN